MAESHDAEAPLVSVVIPTYERTDELLHAIRSVQKQTEDDLEIIVIDDASPTPVASALDVVADDRLRVVRRRARGGGGAARNTGIEAARGRYVAFLDSDDLWQPTKLTTMLDLLAASPAPIGLSAFTAINGDRRTYAVPGLLGRDPFSALITLRGGPMTTSCLVVDRAVVDAGSRFDEDLPALQDHDFVTRAAARYPVACAPQSLVDKLIDPSREHTFTIANQRDALRILLDSHEPLFRRCPLGRSRYLEALALAEMRLGNPDAARVALLSAYEYRRSWRARCLLVASRAGRRPFLTLARILRMLERRSLRLVVRRTGELIASALRRQQRRV